MHQQIYTNHVPTSMQTCKILCLVFVGVNFSVYFIEFDKKYILGFVTSKTSTMIHASFFLVRKIKSIAPNAMIYTVPGSTKKYGGTETTKFIFPTSGSSERSNTSATSSFRVKQKIKCQNGQNN